MSCGKLMKLLGVVYNYLTNFSMLQYYSIRILRYKQIASRENPLFGKLSIFALPFVLFPTLCFPYTFPYVIASFASV